VEVLPSLEYSSECIVYSTVSNKIMEYFFSALVIFNKSDN